MLSEKAKKLGEQPAFEPPVDRQCPWGLTRREYFAAMAMQGLLACPLGTDADEIPKNSVYWADRLLEELVKEGE